jgi:hypothetical protein
LLHVAPVEAGVLIGLRALKHISLGIFAIAQQVLTAQRRCRICTVASPAR